MSRELRRSLAVAPTRSAAGNLAVELSSFAGRGRVLAEVGRAGLERAAGWPAADYRCVSKTPTGRSTASVGSGGILGSPPAPLAALTTSLIAVALGRG